MPRIGYRTKSKEVLKIFKQLEGRDMAQFSALNPSTAKSLRSLEKRINRIGQDVMHLFYDSHKQKGIVQCFAKPKVKKDKIYIEF